MLKKLFSGVIAGVFSLTLFVPAAIAATSLNFSSILGADTGYVKLNAGGCGMGFAEIGSPGNAAPDSSRNYDRGWGAVDYAYGMGTTQVTWAQFTVFMNDTGYRAQMLTSSTSQSIIPIYENGGTIALRPYMTEAAGKAINYIQYKDAVAFANWLGTGSATDTTGMFRLPTADEWYKAAYYDPNKGGADVGGYWRYGTSTDSITKGDAFTPGDVFGGYMSIEAQAAAFPLADFGTANVWELYGMSGGLEDWTSTAQNQAGTKYWALGGNYSTGELCDAATNYTISTSMPGKTGFRVMADLTNIPEPSTYALFAGIAAVGAVVARRCRRIK